MADLIVFEINRETANNALDAARAAGYEDVIVVGCHRHGGGQNFHTNATISNAIFMLEMAKAALLKYMLEPDEE